MVPSIEAVFASVQKALLPWVDRRLTAVYGEHWRDRADRERPRPAGDPDLAALLTLIHTEWSVLGAGVDKLARSHVNELKEFRNRWAHQKPLTDADRLRIVDTASRLLSALGIDEAPAPWPTVVFVACAASKLPHRAKARELYSPSTLFQKCLEQVAADGWPFVVVSSKYGILLPDQEIEPYSRDLAKMSAEQKSDLQRTISDQLQPLVQRRAIRLASMLAGKNYQALMAPVLTRLGVTMAEHERWRTIVNQVYPRR